MQIGSSEKLVRDALDALLEEEDAEEDGGKIGRSRFFSGPFMIEGKN